MSRIVCCISGSYWGQEGDAFFEFSTNTDTAVTGVMPEQEFVEYSTRMYGEFYAESEGSDGMAARMKRARERGASYQIGDFQTLEEFLKGMTLNTYRDGWPGMEKFIEDNWHAEDEPGSEDTILPGDTGQTQKA